MTVGKAVALRRTGSLPALVALEVGAVIGLHRLGGLAAFQIPWRHFGRDLGAWLLYSPVEDVLGAVLRMVALLVAWWLLASTALYLAASVTRVPALIRGVEWLALPVVRRVADRAVAVALATSIAGASPAVAGTLVVRRAPGPIAATAATTTTTPPSDGYVPRPAGRPGSQPAAPPGSTSIATTSTTTTTTTRPTTTSTRAATTSSTAAPPPTTAAPPPTTAAPPPTTAAPPPTTPTVEPPGPKPTFQVTTSTAAPATTTTRAGAPTSTRAGAPTTAPARPPAPTTSAPGPGYLPHPAGTTTTTTKPRGGGSAPPGAPGPGAPGPGAPGPGTQGPGPSGTVLPSIHRVEPGDNLWLIARNQLALATERNPRSLRNSEVAAYWVRVIAANRARLRSKDPDLIYPGEYVRLPAIRKSAGS